MNVATRTPVRFAHSCCAERTGRDYRRAMGDGSALDVALGRPGPQRRAELRDPDAAGDLALLPARSILLTDQGKLALVGDHHAPALWRGAPAEVPGGLRLFLGVSAGTALFAEVVSDWQPAGTELHGLRSVGAILADEDSALATTAVALANWHAVHGRCPRCGEPTEVAGQGWWRTCPRDGTHHFPRTDPAVIALLVDGADRALLGRAARWPEGAYSTLAGFVEPGETAESAVIREICEEVSLVPDTVRYLGSQPWPFPASLMLGFHAHLACRGADPTPDGAEIVAAEWFTRAEFTEACEAGRVRLPARISIANRLIAAWFGGDLPPAWCRW